MQDGQTRSAMRRFVVLRHEGSASYKPSVHWDLMFETDHALRTWALTEIPAADREVEAEQLPEHRLDYLEYEGPISGDRGTVRRWDQGQFQVVCESVNEWIVTTLGQELRGRLILRRRTAGSRRWQCRFEPGAIQAQGRPS